MVWSFTSHPGGFGRKWRFQDDHLPKLVCWHFSPQKMPLGQKSITWKQRNQILGEMSALSQEVDGIRSIRFGFLQNGIPRDIVIGMESDNIAGWPRRRWWWTCPGCLRRCKAVFLLPGKGQMRCRVCGSITYGSRQRENPKRIWKSMENFIKKHSE